MGLLVLILTGKGVSTMQVYILYLAVSSGMFLINFVILLKLSKSLRFEVKAICKLLTFAKWLFACNLMYIIFQRLDVLILASYIKLEELGQYGAALRIVMVASLMTGSISTFLLPHASKTGRDSVLLRTFLTKAFYITVLLTGTVVVLWIAAPLVIDILFGSQYTDCLVLVRIILIGVAFSSVYTPLSQLFMAEEKPKKLFFLGVFRLCSILSLCLILVPLHGAIGAAWALTASELVAMLFTLFFLRAKIILKSS
jgi:O-antigen/teichoic acid export membrane protein